MEIVYISLLLASILAGFPVRTIRSRWKKQLIPSGLGIGAVLLVCGWETIYPFIAILATHWIIKSRARHTEIFSFVFAFLFLLFYRNCSIFGLPASTDMGSGVVMMMTLKLVGLAIDVHEFRENSKQDSKTTNSKFQRSIQEEPEIYEILCYSFCYIGILTGPLFRLKTYRDFISQSPEEARFIPWKEEVKERIKLIAMFFMIFIVGSKFFSVEHFKTEEFYAHGFFYRLFYSFPILLIAKSRFYCGWLLSECACITVAFGAYPERSKPRSGYGPTVDTGHLRDEKSQSPNFSFETIKCINPRQVEWSTTIREVAKNWNMTVHWWLVHYVYKKMPRHLGYIRECVVFIWSAFWHGVYPGYYLSFMTMPFVMAAENVLAQKLRKGLDETSLKYYEKVQIFFKMRVLEYCCMPFLILTWKESLRWWKSLYFIWHFIAFFIVLGGFLYDVWKSRGLRGHDE